jgi:hypothetical protein
VQNLWVVAPRRVATAVGRRWAARTVYGRETRRGRPEAATWIAATRAWHGWARPRHADHLREPGCLCQHGVVLTGAGASSCSDAARRSGFTRARAHPGGGRRGSRAAACDPRSVARTSTPARCRRGLLAQRPRRSRSRCSRDHVAARSGWRRRVFADVTRGAGTRPIFELRPASTEDPFFGALTSRFGYGGRGPCAGVASSLVRRAASSIPSSVVGSDVQCVAPVGHPNA